MADQKPFHRLTFKLMAVLLLAAIAAGVLFFACRISGRLLIQSVYLSPRRMEERAVAEIQDFRSFVYDNRVVSTDAQAVSQWSAAHPHVRLSIIGKATVVIADHYGAELNLSDFGLSLQLRPQAVFDFPVNFADGSYTVSVYDFSEQRLYTAVDLTSLSLSAVCFLLSMLLYDRHITHSVLHLSRQVRQVSRGDLQTRIQSPSTDEIGQLAEDVETMRLSIIDQLRREESAWQANTQLITAISHDVRTPLTALMGYLDILDTPDEQARKIYLDVCRHNAARLKDLTDELFAFFLLFGQATPDQKLEVFDAGMLMEQILLEAREELRQQGFDVRLEQPDAIEGSLKIDLNHLRRVFDNLFSNLRKYADPSRPVTVCQQTENGSLTTSVTNFIRTPADAVESNKIGLKTCEKLISAMGGTFRLEKTQDQFTAVLSLPLLPPETS